LKPSWLKNKTLSEKKRKKRKKRNVSECCQVMMIYIRTEFQNSNSTLKTELATNTVSCFLGSDQVLE
jgi:hypothetical protein